MDICFHAIAACYAQLRPQYRPAIQNCGRKVPGSSERYLIAVAAIDRYRYCGCNCGRYHRYLLPWLGVSVARYRTVRLGYPHSFTSIFISKKEYFILVIEILYSIFISPHSCYLYLILYIYYSLFYFLHSPFLSP
jgi:hypothetical protein